MFHEILSFIYPHRCPCCGTVLPGDILICSECKEKLKPVKPPYCFSCGRHIDSSGEEFCDRCKKYLPGFSVGMAAFEYNDTMRESISRFKFRGWRENASFYTEAMAQLLGERILAFEPEVLIPVPVHRKRRLYRGFNQAELLADGIGEKLGIPVVKNFLIREKATEFQKTLKRGERSKNLEEAFVCVREGKEAEYVYTVKRAMLVDDIYTTGSTMENCMKALKRAGVCEVGIISLSIVGGC